LTRFPPHLIRLTGRVSDLTGKTFIATYEIRDEINQQSEQLKAVVGFLPELQAALAAIAKKPGAAPTNVSTKTTQALQGPPRNPGKKGETKATKKTATMAATKATKFVPWAKKVTSNAKSKYGKSKEGNQFNDVWEIARDGDMNKAASMLKKHIIRCTISAPGQSSGLGEAMLSMICAAQGDGKEAARWFRAAQGMGKTRHDTDRLNADLSAVAISSLHPPSPSPPPPPSLPPPIGSNDDQSVAEAMLKSQLGDGSGESAGLDLLLSPSPASYVFNVHDMYPTARKTPKTPLRDRSIMSEGRGQLSAISAMVRQQEPSSASKASPGRTMFVQALASPS